MVRIFKNRLVSIDFFNRILFVTNISNEDAPEFLAETSADIDKDETEAKIKETELEIYELRSKLRALNTALTLKNKAYDKIKIISND